MQQPAQGRGEFWLDREALVYFCTTFRLSGVLLRLLFFFRKSKEGHASFFQQGVSK
jgi:hypothetical protein